ncbi:helix-turn-helix domain-containing protein [Phenylobacterium soli]|uniref:helix-turn-helix domain-containing protein n=1 Tax=Phenylobacterium soli TaxID=2170551 RepID=UPI00361E319E
MPLDTGGLSEVETSAADGPTLQSGADVGQALKAMREARGLTLDQLAEATRVRASYLEALEEMQLEKLPSRPFVVGYIRAYAQALGADADEAVHRFKAEEPVLDEPLPEPVGVRDERDPRLAAIVAGAVVIIGAIVAWNVVQRIMTETAPAPPTASETVAQKALANTTAGPVSLGAPLPAPVESTTPPPYVTPGLDKAVNAEGQPLVPPQAAQPAPEMNLAGTFTPKGQIYGAPAAQGAVILQALKPAFLVIKGADGSVYFARQLAEGEAYRAANLAGLTVDVSEPEAFQVFSGGQSRGVLPQPLTPVAKLVAPAPPPAPPPADAPKPAAPATASAQPAPAAAKPQAPAAKPAPKPPQ